uniref:Uncharacterized protein n=1 Tax=Anopheles braziliensis TaxID=58242 RepID=A0A2M3ZME4_9DIPT
MVARSSRASIHPASRVRPLSALFCLPSLPLASSSVETSLPLFNTPFSGATVHYHTVGTFSHCRRAAVATVAPANNNTTV